MDASPRGPPPVLHGVGHLVRAASNRRAWRASRRTREDAVSGTALAAPHRGRRAGWSDVGAARFLGRAGAMMQTHAKGSGIRVMGGLGLGAALMYFLDPERGTRRRHLVRDQVVHAGRVAGDALDTTGRDLRDRAQGI